MNLLSLFTKWRLLLWNDTEMKNLNDECIFRSQLPFLMTNNTGHHFNGSFPGKFGLANCLFYSCSPLDPNLSILSVQGKMLHISLDTVPSYLLQCLFIGRAYPLSSSLDHHHFVQSASSSSYSSWRQNKRSRDWRTRQRVKNKIWNKSVQFSSVQ